MTKGFCHFANTLQAAFTYTKVFWLLNFFLLGFVNFWQKEIGAKAVRKMLLKLTTGHHILLFWNQKASVFTQTYQ